jgi:hypothetical protein
MGFAGGNNWTCPYDRQIEITRYGVWIIVHRASTSPKKSARFSSLG